MSIERRRLFYLILFCLLIAAGLAAYAVTFAFAWDEGFHVLTAELISEGKRPYIDFCFPQTPLNAYWNALWILIFGASWKAIHVVAAMGAAVATLLASDFVLRRFRIPEWRFPAALTVACLVGTNVAVIQFGTIGQAYGLCLFLIVLAFRLVVEAVDRGWFFAALSGLAAGTAAASSLLTAPVAPVSLLWILFYNRAGGRWSKFAAFVVGAAIPFIPVAMLFAAGPKQTWFNIIQYHLLYRKVEWEGAIAHDAGVLTDWIVTPQALILIFLSLAWLIYGRQTEERPRRAEMYLCLWLAVTEALHISNAHPTFQRYYLFTVPFLAIPAVAGLYQVAVRLNPATRPVLPTLLVAVLVVLNGGKTVWENREDFSWKDFDGLARKVDEVTPRNAMVLGDEHIYFLTRRPVPSGMELADSHKLSLSPQLMSLYHLISRAELSKKIKAGAFATVETCDDDTVTKEGLPDLYSQKSEMDNCTVFWGWKPGGKGSPPGGSSSPAAQTPTTTHPPPTR
ncbi:MAG TPA: hypothetical protein VKU01_22155 [Bryobacteraceae bacterium]|nr:hypothetical protein [Bryobacteraceae bacterium]